MILITVVAIAIYSLKSFFFLGHIELSPAVTLPDVDTTLLAGFGVSQRLVGSADIFALEKKYLSGLVSRQAS